MTASETGFGSFPAFSMMTTRRSPPMGSVLRDESTPTGSMSAEATSSSRLKSAKGPSTWARSLVTVCFLLSSSGPTTR